MRRLILALMLLGSSAHASIISWNSFDAFSNPTFTDLNGTGLDVQWSATGGPTNGGTFSQVGGGIEGDPTRIGWVGSGLTLAHQNDLVLRMDALAGGTGDWGIGFRKNFGNASLTQLSLRSDGVFSDFGADWTLAGDTLTFNPGASTGGSFFSGTDWASSLFVPRVSGATFIEFEANRDFALGGNVTQRFDTFLISGSGGAAVPEPSSGMLLVAAMMCFGIWHRERRIVS